MQLNILHRAASFADICHATQLRKFSKKPYIIHPMRVASRVALLPEMSLWPGFSRDPEVLATCWLHDVMEDCNIPYDMIDESFGPVVSTGVDWLTNRFDKAKCPDLSREERKTLEVKRIKNAPSWVKVIKLVDRIDNLESRTEAPIKWLSRYYDESYQLFNALRSDDLVIQSGLIDQCIDLLAAIKIIFESELAETQ